MTLFWRLLPPYIRVAVGRLRVAWFQTLYVKPPGGFYRATNAIGYWRKHLSVLWFTREAE